MRAPVTITMPVPTAYAVEPARLIVWLAEHGWAHDPALGGPDDVWYSRGIESVWMSPNLAHAIAAFARAEGLAPHTLAALLASTAPGPALQWAHASADTCAPVLALLDVPAAHHREAAARARERGDTERALYHDGRALGLEAAAAVLRGGQRG